MFVSAAWDLPLTKPTEGDPEVLQLLEAGELIDSVAKEWSSRAFLYMKIEKHLTRDFEKRVKDMKKNTIM